MLVNGSNALEYGMTAGSLAVLLLVGSHSGWTSREDHLARLVGDLNEEALDLLKIDVGHGL